MDADALHKLDSIYRFFQEQPGEHNAESICHALFPDKPMEQAAEYIRRLIADDVRFEETGKGVFRAIPQEKKSPRLQDLNWCVFDLETTGGTPPLHRIIEIGAVRIEKGEMVKDFKALVQPNRPIPDYVVRLTGITDGELKGAPQIEEVLPQFMEFAKDTVLVAHNALFDINFLDYELRRLGMEPLKEAGVCTLKMSRGLLKDEVTAHKLEALAEHFGLTIEDRHRAWDDAKATAQILLHFLKLLDQDGPADRNTIRKYLLEPRGESLSKALMGPDDVENLPRTSGVVLFKDRSDRVLQAAPFKNIQRELRGMLYADMRGSSLKTVFRKASGWEVKETSSYLEAVLEAAKVRLYSRGVGRNSWYLKIVDAEQGLVAVTPRKIKDSSVWYGPFPSMDDVVRRLGPQAESVDTKTLKIPGRSSWTKAFRLQGNLSKSLKGLGFSSQEADFILAVPPAGEQEIEFLLVREGNVVERFKVEDMLSEGVNDSLIEKLTEVFVNRPKAVKKRRDPQHEQEYQALMDWLNRESRQESHCRVFRIDLKDQGVEEVVALMLLGIRDWIY